ncbi:NAD(P)-dependent oxidoreductase [Cobetia sp. 4B]|nr:NAD(P)-dependent oxidoreductase [Gammaproteobacteria bacterium]QWN35641.1 NAD(P)-dependent oxidoreductase [Cobetia sp. 4B]
MAVAAPEGQVASHSSFSAEVYLMALATSQQVQKVLTGKQGLLRRAPPGSTVIDLCSGDVTLSRELAVQTHLAGHHWLEAATSRNPADEANASLTLLIGSDEATVTRMTTLLDAICTQHLHVGDAGCGHAAALASDYLHAAHLITTAEAVAMAYRAGVTPQACIDAINLGAGRSAVSEVNFPRWVLPGRYDSGISTGHLRRDLRLARSFVTTLNLPEGLMKAVFERCQPPELCPADEDDLHHLCDRWLSKVPAQLPLPRLTEPRAPKPQALAISALPDADH